MLKNQIRIKNWASLSPLGVSRAEVASSYKAGMPKFSKREISGALLSVATLSDSQNEQLEKLATSKRVYGRLDRTTLMAMYCARMLLAEKSTEDLSTYGLNIGSSRGATGLWEKYYDLFSSGKALTPFASPVTTAGNVSSWVARDCAISGLSFSHSVTCSTGLHAIVNAAAWLHAGFCSRVIAGGVEAAITPFTIAQMKALGIYSSKCTDEYPCRPLSIKAAGENTFVLGEGAALFDLELAESGSTETGQLIIEGIGFANETEQLVAGMSAEGQAIQRSLAMAMNSARGPVDIYIAHAPGTELGDAGEMQALAAVFSDYQQNCPELLSNKHLIGHTFAASGPLSLELACLLLQGLAVPKMPYELMGGARGSFERSLSTVGRVALTSTGFGGNVVSLVVSRG